MQEWIALVTQAASVKQPDELPAIKLLHFYEDSALSTPKLSVSGAAKLDRLVNYGELSRSVLQMYFKAAVCVSSGATN